jgi:5-methylcytosine-specific restriction endonuclease McrA
MSETWTDYRGRVWKVTTMRGRLKFKIPCHAAIREHIFTRDDFKCVRCGAKAINIPFDYDGRQTLNTDTFDGAGWRDVLVLDHILTLAAGGRNVVENFQTLCEVCNKRKGHTEDKAAREAARERQKVSP